MNTMNTNNKKARKGIAPWAVGALAAVAIAGTVGGVGVYNHNYAPSATVGLDVNPSIVLQVTASQRVLEATGLNDDAKAVLAGMDLTDTDLDVAVNAIVGAMVTNGYITDTSNSLLVSVDSDDDKVENQIRTQLSTSVNASLASHNVEGAVLSVGVESTEEIRELAQQANISEGKAALVEHLSDIDETLEEEDLVNLSVHELNLLMEARQTTVEGMTTEGQANQESYIGAEAATQAAIGHAALTLEQITLDDADLDYENGRMVYEVEFHDGTTEYEYHIDATTGEVVTFETDLDTDNDDMDDDNDDLDDDMDDDQIPADGNYLTPEAAAQAALAHAALTAEQVVMEESELEQENGRTIYEVKFEDGTTEYEYRIDATTGEIITFETDLDDDNDDMDDQDDDIDDQDDDNEDKS